MSEETPTQEAAPTPNQEAPTAPLKEEVVELEIDGVKKSFKPQQLLNVIKQYEDLSKKSSEWQASQTQIENLFASLKQNPESLWDLAESLGHDPRELTKSKFKQYLDYEKLTPEQKKVYELERKLSSYEKEQKKLAEEKKAQEQESLIDTYYQNLEKEFTDFYKESGVTPNKELAQDLVRHQREQLELTGKRPSVKESYKALEKKNAALRNKLLKSLKEDEIPEELVKVVRQKLAKEAKKFPFTKSKSSLSQAAKPSGSKKNLKKPLSIDDFFK